MKVTVVTVLLLACMARMATSSDSETPSTPKPKLELWNAKCMENKQADGCEGSVYASPYPQLGGLCEGERPCERCQLSTLAVIKRFMKNTDTSSSGAVINALKTLVTGADIPTSLTSSFSRSNFCAGEMGPHSKTWFPLLFPGTTVKFCKRIAKFFGSSEESDMTSIETWTSTGEPAGTERVLPRQIMGTMGQFYYYLSAKNPELFNEHIANVPFASYQNDPSRTVDSEMDHGGLPDYLLAFARDLCSCSDCGCGSDTCGYNNLKNALNNEQTSEPPKAEAEETRGLRGSDDKAKSNEDDSEAVDETVAAEKALDSLAGKSTGPKSGDDNEAFDDASAAKETLDSLADGKPSDGDVGVESLKPIVDVAQENFPDEEATFETRPEKSAEEIIAKLKALHGVQAVGLNHLPTGIYGQKGLTVALKTEDDKTEEDVSDVVNDRSYVDPRLSEQEAVQDVRKELEEKVAGGFKELPFATPPAVGDEDGDDSGDDGMAW